MFSKREVLEGILDMQVFGKTIKILDEETIEDQNLLKRMSLLTEGMSGRDIKKVLDLALNKSILEEKKINYQLLWESLEEWMIGKEKKTSMTEQDLKRIAYHELGHAVIGKHFGKIIHQISIATKNMSLGQTFSTEGKEEILPIKEKYIFDVYELLGGRAAEKIYMNNISAGSQNDYERSTNLLIKYLLVNFSYEIHKGNLKKIAKELGDSSIEKMNTQIKLGIVTQDFENLPDFLKDRIYKFVSIIIADCEIEVEKLLKHYSNVFDYYGPLLMKEKTIFENNFTLDV